jgi:hypothetical protein
MAAATEHRRLAASGLRTVPYNETTVWRYLMLNVDGTGDIGDTACVSGGGREHNRAVPWPPAVEHVHQLDLRGASDVVDVEETAFKVTGLFCAMQSPPVKSRLFKIRAAPAYLGTVDGLFTGPDNRCFFFASEQYCIQRREYLCLKELAAAVSRFPFGLDLCCLFPRNVDMFLW